MVDSKKYYVIWLIGLMSGFTLMISGSTLNFWMSIEQIDLKTIGVFALVSLPYAINFLWAPVFDTFKLSILEKNFGQRISWVILLQVLLSIIVYMMSMVNPKLNIGFFAVLALIISFLASAQDTVLGALRTEMISRNQQNAVSGTYIFGYRIGMLLSGYGAIYLNGYVNFGIIYELFSLVVLIFPVILIVLSHYINHEVTLNKPVINQNITYPEDFIAATKALIQNILKPIGSVYFIVIILAFLVTYRLADNFIVVMINPFLIEVGYSTFEIANAGKLFGIISSIIGGLLASKLMKDKDIFSSLILFGSIHAVSHLVFILIEIYGKNIILLFFAVGLEGISGGMTMAAYMAFIAALCHGKFRATQYSFFSSMMGLSRSVLPAISGYIVAIAGWKFFFVFSTLAAIPPLFIAWHIKKLPDAKRVISD